MSPFRMSTKLEINFRSNNRSTETVIYSITCTALGLQYGVYLSPEHENFKIIQTLLKYFNFDPHVDHISLNCFLIPYYLR